MPPLSYKNDEQSNERLDPYLRRAEQQTGENAGSHESIPGYNRSKDGLDDHPVSAGIADAKEQENTPTVPNNEYGYNPSSGKQKGNGRMALVKKLGPTGIITLLFGGGAGILMTLLAPGIALIHVKEIVENKINTQAAVLQTRSDKLMASRLLGGTNKAIKGCSNGTRLFCRYSKLGQAQIQAMEKNGIIAKDSKGNILSSAELESGKVRPKTLQVGQDGKPLKASSYQRLILTDTEFRNAMRNVYPSRFASWNDKIATHIATLQNWVRNPKTTTSDEGGSSKANQGEYDKNLSEETKGLDDPLSGVGNNEYTDAIDQESQKIQTDQSSGKPTNIDTSIKGTMAMPETNTGSKLGGAIKSGLSGVLNPIAVVNTLCTSKDLMQGFVFAAKIPAMIQTIRFASSILSGGDKAMAGDATPNDVAMPMNMLERNNSDGKAFGDSQGYSYVEYNKPTDTLSEAVGRGNWSTSFFSTLLTWMATMAVVKTIADNCSTINSAGGLVVENIIGGIMIVATAGGGKAFTEGLSEGILIAVKKLTEKIMENISGKISETSAKDVLKSVFKQARSIGGFFVGGVILSKLFTPFMAHLATGTLLSGDMNGVAAMDNLVAGAGAMNQGVAQQRGMTALTPSQAMAFLGYNDSSTATYIADQQKQANPLDINNPYSASNQLGFSLSSFFSSVNLAQNPGSILSLPSKVLSAFDPANIPSTYAYADSTAADQQALMNECQDTDATQNGTIATDPFCNPIYGFDNVSMLQNTDPSDVADWMYQNGYIDSDGNPTSSPTPDYASYVSTCFGDAAASQTISTILDSSDLPAECYKPTGISQETYDYWHLYQIDNSVIDTMDNGFQTNSTTNTDSSSTSSSNSFAWPVDKKYWSSNKSLFLSPHTPSTGTAWGADSMGTTDKGAGIADDIPLPAGTHVYAIVDGIVTSTNLCGANDGIAIKSNIQGGTLGISYMHGTNKQFKVGDNVTAGSYIMDIGSAGCNATGPHLHIGAAFNGHYLCPQDIFTAMGNNQTPDLSALVSKGVATCGR